MLDSLLLSNDEISTLTDLYGLALNEVEYDKWSVRLHCDRMSVSILPEEIPLHGDRNPWGDIVTLRIENLAQSQQVPIEESMLTNCGYITSIARLESHVEIGEPEPTEASEIRGVIIPEGLGWTNIISSPNEQSQNPELHRALLGLEFETDKGMHLAFYTNAVGYFVQYHFGPGLPSVLQNKCARINISDVG
jgi:hypothetical protein